MQLYKISKFIVSMISLISMPICFLIIQIRRSKSRSIESNRSEVKKLELLYYTTGCHLDSKKLAEHADLEMSKVIIQIPSKFNYKSLGKKTKPLHTKQNAVLTNKKTKIDRNKAKKLKNAKNNVKAKKGVIINEQDALKRQNLRCHNNLRAKHQAQPLEYTEELSNKAQIIANKIIDLVKVGEVKTKGLGKGVNAYFSWSRYFDGATACQTWYDSGFYYDYDQTRPPKSTEEFTLLIWNGSTNLGYGYNETHRKGKAVVCTYDPPGNIPGKYSSNVFPPVKLRATGSSEMEHTNVENGLSNVLEAVL